MPLANHHERRSLSMATNRQTLGSPVKGYGAEGVQQISGSARSSFPSSLGVDATTRRVRKKRLPVASPRAKSVVYKTASVLRLESLSVRLEAKNSCRGSGPGGRVFASFGQVRGQAGGKLRDT